MRFLVDTNICSEFLRGNSQVFNRFIQHTGGIAVSTVVLGELYAWCFRAAAPPHRLQGVTQLLRDVYVLPVDADVAHTFGRVRALLLDQGRPTPGLDLLIAAMALVHDLTLVTHNAADFIAVPGLQIEDWLAS